MSIGPDPFTDSAQAVTASNEVLLDKFVHVHGLGWLMWTGRVWREVPAKAVVEAVRDWTADKLDYTIASRPRQSEGEPDAEWERRFKAWLSTVAGWKKRQSEARLRAVVSLAQGIRTLDPHELDAHDDLLNTMSGVVDLRTGQVKPSLPTYYFTKVTGSEFDPKATHPDWTAALEALPESIVTWLQVRYGQAITGYMCPDDRVVIQQGGGQNGKSTVLDAVAAALGDYFLLASDKILMAQHPTAHTTDLHDLRGARFVAIEETPEAGRLDVVRLKKVAGTSRITARKMHTDNVSFRASHTLFVNSNYPPQVGETDEGTWRRLLLVVFPYTFTRGRPPRTELERQGDDGVKQRLPAGAAQRAAVLRWLVDGAVTWYGTGFPPVPAIVESDTAEWRGQTDLVAAFINDWLEFDPGSFVVSEDLVGAFNAYLKAHGNSGVAESTFKRRFSSHRLVAESLITEYRMKLGPQQRFAVSRPASEADPFAKKRELPAGGQVRGWSGVRFRGADLDAHLRSPLPGLPGHG